MATDQVVEKCRLNEEVVRLGMKWEINETPMRSAWHGRYIPRLAM